MRLGAVRLWIAAYIAASLIAGAALAGDFEPKPAAERSALPRFELKTLDGKRFVTRSLAGKVSVISFWASWCVPCQQELTVMTAYQKKIGADRFNLIAIATDGPETIANVRSTARRRRWSHLILSDPDGAATSSLNPRGSIPFTLFLDRAGRMAYTHAGYASGDEKRYEKLIAVLMAEPGD